MMIKRTSALALPMVVVLGLAGLSGCATYGDSDFATRCAGSLYFRGFDAAATHEVVVQIPSGWLDEAVASSVDVTKSIEFPSDTVGATFLIGQNLADIDLNYCTDFGSPPPIDVTLTATSGEAEIVLHPAAFWRDVTADLTLTNISLGDTDTTVTVSGFSMTDAPVGRHA